jgi:hypothetical protein
MTFACWTIPVHIAIYYHPITTPVNVFGRLDIIAFFDYPVLNLFQLGFSAEFPEGLENLPNSN